MRQPKDTRLNLPLRLKSQLPYISDAIKCLRLSTTIRWIGPQKHEERVRPFFKDFDATVRAEVDRLAELHGVSRSKVITTALDIQAKAPALGVEPSGYRENQ